MPSGHQICFVFQSVVFITMSLVTTSSATKGCSTFLLPSGKCCVFPFEYNGTQYNECTVDGLARRPWCATTSNFTQDGQREYCELRKGWCPSGWFRLKSSCVFMKKDPARLDYDDEVGVTFWRKAREKCNEKGADLMIVRDKADLNGLLSMYYQARVSIRRPLFLGSREYFNPHWKWLDGTEVNPALWGSGEPKTIHGRCGVIEDFRKRWFDRGCGWWLAARPCNKIRRAYICESPLTNRTCKQGYSLAEDRCYKIVTSLRLIWEDAQWDCLTQNSSLAVINTKENFERVASLLSTVKWPYSFFVGLVRNLSSWSWIDGISIDPYLFRAGYPKIRDKEENCIAFSGYTPDIINVGCNNGYAYACQSAQAVVGNVAFGSLTDHSSLATGSNSSFVVDDNLTTCFSSKVEESPWLEIKLVKWFYIYKVTIKNPKNTSIPEPLTVSIISRNRNGESTTSVCTKKGNSSYLEYQCIPPVRGDTLYIKGSKLNTALVLCHVSVLAFETEENAKGVLREVWLSETADENPLLLRDLSAFTRQRDLWNIIPRMDATVNLGKFYAQKLNAYMKVTDSGYHTFYMTCNDECELWFDGVEDLEGLGAGQSERKMLIKLVDMKTLERLTWDRSLSKQISQPIYLSRCHLYNIEVFMREYVNEDHLSIGIKFPNGEEQKPVYAKNLFWLKTGERSLVFSNIRFEPGNKFTAEVGSIISIAGSYKYCCQGIFCPDCDLRVAISVFYTEYIINSSLSMNCRENSFNISLEADVTPGFYGIQAQYSFVDENATKHLEIAQVSMTAAVLSQCSFFNDLCQWKEKTTNGSSWKTGGDYQGAYLLGVSEGSLESPKMPWKESFKETYSCLQFKYILPGTTTEGRNSTLEVFVGNEEQMALLWRVQGYHGNKSSRGYVSWESKKDVMIELKATSYGKASAVIQEVKIITNYCEIFPLFAMPGHSCSKEEFQCENLQCIKSVLRCDGDLNCLDGSDEENCQCLNGQFSCSSGTCLPPEKLRDGKQDCVDGQDEKKGGVNPNSKYPCFDGKAISWSQTCKKTESCADSSHFSAICGKTECPLNDLACSKQTGDAKKDKEDACQIPFRGSCSFQNGLCGFQNGINSEFQWTTEIRGTLSEGTGPSFDHTILSDQGRYLYIEASNRQAGDKARLQSGWFLHAPELCLQFWYHMYGEDIGSLNIYIGAMKSEEKVWSQQGNQGDRWIFAQVPINSGGHERQFQILIEGVIGGGSSGDIAIDDITVLTGSCIKIVKQETLDCYFENGLCGWTGENDWKIESTVNNGKFLYFKTDRAELISRTLITKELTQAKEWRCLTFWYFIGEEKRTHTNEKVVELNVSALHPDNSSDVTTLWSTSYRTNRWTYVQLPLHYRESPFKILFRGTLDSAEVVFLGIDDISFSREKCNAIPNDEGKDICTWVTGYHTCCRFPFVYENTLYHSCTGDDNDRQWCYFGDDEFDAGGCDDKCLWTTESGKCCSFPFEYKNRIYSSCITTPDKPRPWCATELFYDFNGLHWDFCKDYCSLGRELCLWKVDDGYIAWKNVSREETANWNKKVKSALNADHKAFEVTPREKDEFIVILPLAEFGNISVPIALENDLKAVTVCVWLQTNQSVVDITYWTKLADCPEESALGINLNSTITVTVLEEEWKVPSFVADQEWHHVCLTWSSFGGFLKVFVDGLKLVSTSDSSIDTLDIRGRGRLTVNCTDVKNSTKVDACGRTSDLNLWEGALDEEEIQRMSLGCGMRDGDLMAWRSMISGIIGDAHVHYDTSACRDVTGNRLAAYSLSSNITTEQARVWSPWYNRSADGYGRCLKFRYMILGVGNNNLRLYQIMGNNSKENPIWQGDSTRDDTWQYGQVSVTGITEHQLIFEGNLEDQIGFISIGALYFINGYCSPEPEAAARRACRELFTDKTGVITSPYYPGYYANDSWCEWLVTAAIGHVIRLEFFYFQLEATEPQCLSDYVEVFDGNSTYSTSLGRFCGHTHPAMLESSSNNLLVVFKSDNKGMRTGFKAYYDMRKDERDKCKMKPDCPVGCTCYITKGPPSQYVLEGAEYMESIPWNLSSLTTVLLFAGSKITRLRNRDFYSLSSLTYMDLSHNKVFQMESRTFESLKSLETLRLNNNFLRQLNSDVFSETTKLQYLDIGENLLVDLQEGVFDNLTDLRILSLRSNSIRHIKRDVFKRTTRLTHLYLDYNQIIIIEEKAFASLSQLRYLHLHNNGLKRLTKGMFTGLILLTTLRLHENTILESEIATDIFEGLLNLRILSLDSFIVCCYAKKAAKDLICDSPKNEFSSCEDMMKNPIIRVCLWILGIVALVGNLSVIFWRLVYGEDSKVQSFLLKNLAVADFIMGVYLIIIAVQDTRWQGEYFEHDVRWRGGTLCQVTGALSMLSSEVSVMLLTVITADRLICIVFHFRVQPLSLKTCYLICLLVWLLGFVISFLPMSGLSYFNAVGNGNGFYGRSTVCLALQLSNDRPPGWEYSVSIFIGFNLAAFLFISLSYVAIFLSAVKSSSAIRSTNVKRESTLAKRVAFIILTDFCCWMPVIIVGILSLTGSFNDPEKQVYVWMAVFVLPFNSSVNPILYTLATPQMRDWFCKDSKSKEDGNRGIRPVGKSAAFSTTPASNPTTGITTIELSVPSLKSVANLERSGYVNKGFQDDTSQPERSNSFASVESGSLEDNSSATYDTHL